MVDPNLILKPDKKKPNDIVILEAINENPLIHHNKLKKLVSNDMATATFDKTIKNLIVENKVEVTRFADNKKHYSIPNTDWLKHKDFESNIRNQYKMVSNFIDENFIAMKSFQTFQKGSIVSNCIKWILKEINMLTLFEICFAQTKYITELKRSYMKKLLDSIEIIKQENDGEKIINYVFDDISGFTEFQQAVEKYESEKKSKTS